MCVVCPIVAGVVIVGGLIVKSVNRTWPKPSAAYPPPPKPMPVPSPYGEDLED